VKGGRLPGRGGVRGEHDLAHLAIRRAVDELGDLQVLGIDAVDRREGAAQHVVEPAELVGALDGNDVAGLLDDADDRAVAPLVLADAAARALGEVEAHLAEADLLLHLADRVGEGVGALGVLAEDVEGQPLGAALADSGKLRELGDQAVDGARVHGRPRYNGGQTKPEGVRPL
jgi:hypothetical protein